VQFNSFWSIERLFTTHGQTFVEQFHKGRSIYEIRQVSKSRDTLLQFGRNGRFTCLTFTGIDDNNPIRTSRTVNGSRGRILQDGEAFDVLWVDIVDITIWNSIDDQ